MRPARAAVAFLLCCLWSPGAGAQGAAVVRGYDLRDLEALAAGLTLDDDTQGELARGARLALGARAALRFPQGEKARPGQASAFVLELFQALLPKAEGYELSRRGLSFSAAPEVHARAAAVLKALRRSLTRGARLELRAVEAPAELAGWADAAAGAPVTTETAAALEAAIAAGQARAVSAFEAPFRDGEVRLLSEVEATEYLSGYEINQTGAWPVLNATRGVLLTGEACQVHLCRRPGGGYRLDVHRERAERLGMREAAFPKAGTLELPRIALERQAASAELEAGRLTLLARRSRAGRLSLLVARATPARAETEGGASLISRYPLRSLLEPVFDFPLPRPWDASRGAVLLDFDREPDEEREHLGSLSQARARYPEFFLALERALSLKDSEERSRRLAVFRGALFVLGPAAVQEQAAAVLARWSRRGDPARVELAIARCAPGEAPGFGPLAEAAAAPLLQGAERISLAGFVGQQVQWDRLIQQAFLGALERSAGGQGVIKLVSQPVVDVVSQGRSLRLRPLEGSAGVELELEEAPPASLRTATTAWGPLDLVEQGPRLRLSGVHAAPTSGAVVLGSSLLGEEARVFLLRARP